jgi:hypothetical protein
LEGTAQPPRCSFELAAAEANRGWSYGRTGGSQRLGCLDRRGHTRISRVSHTNRSPFAVTCFSNPPSKAQNRSTPHIRCRGSVAAIRIVPDPPPSVDPDSFAV